jgi:electron transport complex protein RnfC
MTRELERSLREFERNLIEPLGKAVYWGPATVCAIYDAVKFGLPPMVRYVAVGGSAVKNPRVMRVRVGSPFRQVFEECGGLSAPPKRVASGSPVMGRPAVSLDEPVTTYTYAIFAVAGDKSSTVASPHVLDLRSSPATPHPDHPERRTSTTTPKQNRYMSPTKCINCGACRDVCPSGLNPERLYKQISKGYPSEKTETLVRKCSGCGCCAAACPSSLPLSVTIIAERDRNHSIDTNNTIISDKENHSAN